MSHSEQSLKPQVLLPAQDAHSSQRAAGMRVLEQSPVRERIGELHDGVAKLHALFDELEQRLSPVMAAWDTSDRPEPDSELQSNSEVGKAIEMAHQGLQTVTGRIARILHGLEI